MGISNTLYQYVMLILVSLILVSCDNTQQMSWSAQEIKLINSLVLPDPSSLAAKTSLYDPGNAVRDDLNAAKLGYQLFFDPRLSGNGKVACASCHHPAKAFTDNQVLSQGIGITAMHTPSIIGVATSAWLFWDGRADSLWSQALGPLENPAEHGANRLQLAHLIFSHYHSEYQAIFGQLPGWLGDPNVPKDAMPLIDANNATALDKQLAATWHNFPLHQQQQVNQVFANIGKSIAAYERLLMPAKSRFDHFASELNRMQTSNLLTVQEQAGLKLFISDDSSQCLRCHNGPMFTNHDFQVTGIVNQGTSKNTGRIAGIELALQSPFNCRGIYSDTPHNCPELTFAKRNSAELKFAYKVPTLRNVAQTAPYMHNGSISSLMAVLTYYNQAQPQLEPGISPRNNLVHYDLEPLRLMPHQLKQLKAFLLTLSSPPAVENSWLQPPVVEMNTNKKPSIQQSIKKSAIQDRKALL